MTNDALAALRLLPRAGLLGTPTPVEEMPRLRRALGGGPRLLVKRDDAIPFGFGGNKVRKLDLVAADALRAGADTLVTTGGIQSNHCRATAAAAARLGLRCHLVQNGPAPDRATANALLDRLLGAEIEYVGSRQERGPALEAACARLSGEGRRPYLVPLGASVPLGALAFAAALAETLEQGVSPDVIVHSTSSGGTQAGLVVGCALVGRATRVVGVSADDPSASLAAAVRTIVDGMHEPLGLPTGAFVAAGPIDVDDAFVGEGYGIPTAASREAIELAARTEALFLDPTYTAKAMAGLVARVRNGVFRNDETVLFWHTGGQVGLFA
jgi:L-cysteate sulfo-lyase